MADAVASGRSPRLLALPALVLLPLLTALLAWPLLLVVLAVDLLFAPFAVLLRRPPLPRPRRTDAASIIVVSWNGRHFLQRLLPTLRAAVDEHGGDHEVIVVDNGSSDGSVEWLAREHAWVRVVALPENRYFVRGNMAGVAAASRDVVVFLNNDMEVRPGFLLPLLDGLRDPAVFGVSAQVFFKDPHKRREETGRTRGDLRHGALKLAHVLPSRDELELDYAPTFWAGGGSSAFDRRRFLELGGFDLLYDPFYLEDTGLSYQAWKQGQTVLFAARSQVLHEHRGTSRKVFGDDFVDNVIRRNQHLFVWRNITDPVWTVQALGLLPLQVLLRGRQRRRGLAAGLWFETRAFLRALPRVPQALTKRCVSRRLAARGDRDVVALANGIVACRRACGADLGRLHSGPDGTGLNLLVLTARLPRLGVDGSWVLFERLRHLAPRHRVTLFAFVDDAEAAALAEPLRALGIEVITEVRTRNRMPGNWHGLVPWRLWRDYSAEVMQLAVRRAIESTDFDLVQVEYVEMAHLLGLVPGAIPPGVPVVYTCHESLALAEQRAGTGRRRQAQALRHELRLLRRFDRVVTLSSDEAAFLGRWLPAARLTVVPSGIELTAWPLRQREADPATILFVGYFKHAPNADAALWLCREILPRVRASVPQARVALVGRDPPPAVEELAATGSVVLRGFVKDLGEAMAEATVVAVPLRQGGGLRGKLLEAWAAARPVVATPVACEGFAAEDGVHLLRAASADAFAAALVRCLQDPALRRRLGSAGRALVEARYSGTATAAGHERVFRDLLAEAGA